MKWFINSTKDTSGVDIDAEIQRMHKRYSEFSASTLDTLKRFYMAIENMDMEAKMNGSNKNAQINTLRKYIGLLYVRYTQLDERIREIEKRLN
jgi:hypothetical protein